MTEQMTSPDPATGSATDESLRRWIEGAALGRWFAANVAGTTATTLHLEDRIAGSNVHCTVTDGSQRWILRWRRTSHHAKLSLDREYALVDTLFRSGVPVAHPVAFCADREVTTRPFYVMEAFDGATPRTPSALSDVTEEDRPLRSVQVADVLATTRALDVVALGLRDVVPDARELRIDEVARAWEDTRWRSVPELDEAIRRLQCAGSPSRAARALLHDDFHPFNLMLGLERPHPIIAVLDWEVAKIGDPARDLAHMIVFSSEPIGALAGLRPHGTPAGGFVDPEILRDRYLTVCGEDPERLRYVEAREAVTRAVHFEGLLARAAGREHETAARSPLGTLVTALARHALERVAS